MCLRPWKATLPEFGKPIADPEGELTLPCGQCIECKSKRASDWALRAKHEISLHDENCFLTLTYDDDNLPSRLIVKSEFQKFMKRLRKKTKCKLRYMVSHEYGGKTGRPHHHAIIFGYNPSNQVFQQNSPSGEPLFTSTDIDELWTNGFHSIGTATARSAYYIASYSLKAEKHEVLNDDGEFITVTDSMDCSKRPAIGKEYFYANVNQLINSSDPLPRYYVKLLERDFPDLLQTYEENVLQNARVRGDHELLAVYTIKKQQRDFLSSVYRSAPDKIDYDNYEKNFFKSRRDLYAKNQGE